MKLTNKLNLSVPLLLRLVYSFAFNAMFVLPVLILYYNSKGLSTGDFFMVQSIFCIVSFLIEIPTGYFADLYSRRNIIIISVALWFIGNVVMMFANSLAMFIFSETLFGFGRAFLSGTLQAYLYDYLKKQGKEAEALKEQGRLESFGIAILAVTSISGGFLFNYSIILPLIITSVFGAIAICLSLLLPNISEEKRNTDGKSKLKDIIDITKFAINGHSEIKWLIFYPSIMFTSTLIIFWLIQPISEHAGIDAKYFGFILCAGFFVKFFFSHFANNIMLKLGFSKSIVLMLPLMVLPFACFYISSSHSLSIATNILFLAIAILAMSFVHGSGKAIFISLINHRVKSDERATVISVFEMMQRIVSTPALFFMKPLIDYVGIDGAIMIESTMLIIAIIPLIKLYKLNIIR